MRIYTASWTAVWRYSQAVGAGNEGVMPVRISVGAPRFWPQARVFPAAKLITPHGLRKLTGAEFTAAYLAKLERAGVDEVRAELADIYAAYGKPLVLLCFEPDRADCHRGVFAEWWEQQAGDAVPEADLAKTAQESSGRMRGGTVILDGEPGR